jgi:hypothetical protein
VTNITPNPIGPIDSDQGFLGHPQCEQRYMPDSEAMDVVTSWATWGWVGLVCDLLGIGIALWASMS